MKQPNQPVAVLAAAEHSLVVQVAAPEEMAAVAAILHEAAVWLERHNLALWEPDAFAPGRFMAENAGAQYMLARWHGRPAGTFKYQREDALIWPEAVLGEAAYVHRVAIARQYAGSGLAAVLLDAAAARARQEGCRYLRLDCEYQRPRLRAVYERYGFVFHSQRLVGPHHLARYQLELRGEEA